MAKEESSVEIKDFIVDTAVNAKMGWEDTILMPVGDIQLGAQGCDEDRFKRHMEWGMKHNAYFLGMGDYVDVASPSNRHIIRTAKLYDSVQDVLTEGAARAAERFLALTAGSEGRWLGLLQGHHYYEFPDGTTSDTVIAAHLKAPFLGDCAFVRLHFRRGAGVTTATIWCHHGEGYGRGAGAPLTKLQTIMPFFDADIYLMGHMHKVVGAPLDQLYMTRSDPPHLRYRTKIVAGTGSFLRGHMEGSSNGRRATGSYVEKGMLPPVSLGGVVITIKPVHTNAEDHLDMRISL